MKYTDVVEKCSVYDPSNILIYMDFNPEGRWMYVSLENFGQEIEEQLKNAKNYGEFDHILFTDNNERIYFKDIKN